MKKLIIALLLALVLLLFLSCWLEAGMENAVQYEADGANEYAVILGAKVKPGGVPSSSLANRLDAAVVYLQQYPHVKVVVSGGQGPDEDRTEASVMSDYLQERGIENTRILLEEQSTSTYENIFYTKKLLPETVTHITIISNDFHLKRAMLLAKKQGLHADVIPAVTPEAVEHKSRTRERLALIKAYVTGQ